MSDGQGDQLPRQTDLLYLIFKYLETVPGYDSTSAALREDIVKNSSLGNSIGWDGSERITDIDDIGRNYPNIFSNQLSHLLQYSLAGVSTLTNTKPSLLHQMVGVFNPANASQVKRYSELSRKLVEIIGKLRNVNHNTKAANHRITYLEDVLGSTNESCTIFEEDFMTEDVVPVLQEVGRSKELTHLRTLVVASQDTCSLLKLEIDTLTENMAQLGCLSSGIGRGHIDGALNWLQSRELGLTSFGTGSGAALGRALVPSASAMRNKILSQFRVLYTVSGHMMNPAYCCVFDQTGRYLLTGADDYLVKIWDVEKGQLIKTCKGHMGYISLVAVSPDNSLFASACTMGTIRIWRLSDGLCLQVFKHQAAVNWIKFDRTSCALASASDDGQCIVWDLSKLLPEDGGEVPILDVIMEDRAAALKAREQAVAPKVSREVDQLLQSENYYDAHSSNNVHSSIAVENEVYAGTTDACTAGSSSSASAARLNRPSSSSSSSFSGVHVPHAGEARLVSAISNSAEVQFVGQQSAAWAGSTRGNSVGLPLQLNNGTAPASTAMYAPIQHFNSRGGLFRWSGAAAGLQDEETDAMLVLHHIQDILVANSEGEPLKVNCLDVSPMGNILVTGCEDGVARVWRIGDPEPIGAYTTRQPKLPLESLLQKLKTMVSPSEYSRMKRVAGHLLMRLEGHVSPITDIHLNHLGDRVLTGSAQDCNVRIWSISRDLLKNVQVMLDLTEDEEQDGGDAQQQARARNGRNGRSRLKSQLYNACWTADSTKIVTIQSVVTGSVMQMQPPSGGNASDRLPTRLKVWDAMTGDLLKVIWKISDICCRTLCKHPLNPSVVMTCGEDGYINVWDIDQEERLSSTRLLNDDKTPTNIVDASFSDDGSRLAVTDFLGRLSVLGLDDPDAYNKVLSEQYFSTDYLDIMLDNVGFAIDVGTQMPVHEAPIGPLIRLDGTPYATQPPPLKGPPATSKDDIRKMLSEIAIDRKKSQKEMDRVFNIFTRNKQRGRAPKKYQGSKPRALRALEEQNKALQAASNGSSSSNGPVRSNRIQYIEFDVNNYNPSSEDSEDSEYDLHADRIDDHNEPDLSRRHNFGQQRSSQSQSRRRIATLRDISSSSQRRSSRARNNVDYNDALEDNEYRGARDTVASRAARAAERESRRRRQQLLRDDEEDEDEEETEDSQNSDDIVYDDSDGEDARRTTRSRRVDDERDSRRSRRSKNSHRNARSSRIIVDDDEADEAVEREIRARESAVPRPKKVKAPAAAAFYRAKHGIVLGEGVEVGRKWLQTEDSTPQYAPQLGDRVMYFPQGHIQWLQEFQESSSPPWLSFPQKWPVVECEVRDIKYVFPDTPQEHKMCCSVKAQVTLAVIRIPLRNAISSHGQYLLDLVAPRNTRHSGGKEITFSVTLRDWDLPDFLISSDLFLRSIRLAWHAGVKVTVQFKNYSEEEKGYVFKAYTGQVAGISNASPEWPHSPWDCIEVSWDDVNEGSGDGSSRVGPWEAVPHFTAGSDYARVLDKYPLAKVDATEAERMIREIDALMENSQYADLFNPFMYPVDPTVFPSYYLSIAVPICIDTIRNRLENGYYRQVEAIEFDVNLLYENCSNYNDEESDIVAAAAQLQAELHKIVRPMSDVAPLPSSTQGSSSSNKQEEEEVLTLRVRGRVTDNTGSKSGVGGSRSRGHQQSDSLMGAVGAGHSPEKRLLRGGTARDTEETTLRLKRRREPSPEPSPVKSRRSSHRTSSAAAVAVTEAQDKDEEDDDEEEQERETTHRTRGRDTRSTRGSVSQVAKGSSSRSNRSGRSSGRSHSIVNYAEPEEEEEEEQEEEGDEEEEEEEDEDGDSDDEENSSAGRTKNVRSSRHSSRTNHKKERSSRAHPSRSTRQQSESSIRRSSRRKTTGDDENSNDESESEDSASSESEEEEEEEEEDKPQPEMASRSKRTVKAPANFANDMAAALDLEYEKLQQQRSTRRRGEAVAAPCRTTSSSAYASAHPTRSTPSQRYQQQEQARQQQEREAAQAQAHAAVARRAHRLDPEVKRQMLQVLTHAEEIDSEYNIFADPVTEDIAPGYFQLIERPVDLSSIRSNIQTRQYETVAEVIADVLLMYDNCELYNEASSYLGEQAVKQRNDLKRFLRKNHLS